MSPNFAPARRLGTAQWSDVYGSLDWGPSTAQMSSPTIAPAIAAAADTPSAEKVVAEGQQAIADRALSTSTGVLLIMVGALVVLSLSD